MLEWRVGRVLWGWFFNTCILFLPNFVLRRFLPYRPHILKESFSAVRPRIGEYSNKFYEFFFSDYPEVVPLFGRNMTKPELDARINYFMLFIVDHSDRPKEFVRFIRGLAHRHAAYGIQAHQYRYVEETNIKTLKYLAGTRWRDEWEAEWRTGFRFIQKMMLWNGGYGRPHSIHQGRS